MKGPGLRIDHDVRRLWVCPDCSRALRLGGDVSQIRCECQGEESPWMQLIEAAPVIPRTDRDCRVLGGVESGETGDREIEAV